MAITKEKKQAIVKELKEKFDKQKSIVFIDYAGTSVQNLTTLRRNLRETGNELKIAKKTLISRVFKDVDVSGLEGQVGVVFGYEDETSSSKNVYEFTKTHKSIKILGGLLEGNFFEASDVIKLAKLPSKDELLGQLVGILNAPISNFAYVLSSPTSQFVQVLNQIKSKK